MKKPCLFCLAILFACMLMTGCEKVIFPEDKSSVDKGVSADAVPVTFCVASIEQIPFENTTRAVTLSSLCSRISFAVFNAESEKVKSVNQKSDDEEFGTCSVKLDPGTYNVVCIAQNGTGNPTITDLHKVTFTNNKCTDTFLYYGTVTVTKDGGSFNLSLKRIVSMCRIIISDPLPENVATMEFAYTGGSSTLDVTTGFGSVNSRQTEQRTVDKSLVGKETQYEIYTFPHELEDYLDITIRSKDSAGEVLTEQIIENVLVKQNYITQYTTTFFPSAVTPESAIQVSIANDGAWAGTMEY